ncbi:MAG: hypothetical protein Q8O56_07480 [Solirubrobacteraceae bacterium]|nr:hypothetical protein [Solirubrobacteraceae bacterium]
MTVLLAALAAGYALFASDDELSVASSGAVAPGDVVASFRAANLEVGETTPMGPKDYGHGPAVATEGIRFLIPSLGRDNGGRAMSFSSVEDLWSLKEYYDGVGRATAALFSWTFANEQSLVLVQINGDLPASQAHRYRRIIADL